MTEGIRKYDFFLVISCVVSIFVLINFILDILQYGYLSTYLTRPVLWSLLAIVIYKMPAYRTYGKLRLRRILTLAALLVAAFQIIALFAAGIFEGFGKSPYSFTSTGIILNIFYVCTTLFGMELSRAWLISRCFTRRPAFTILWVALVYTLFLFPFSKITGVNSLPGAIRFVGETLLPSFAESLLASFLAFLGGPLPALAYRGILQLFLWFSPILPSLSWTTQALIGVFFPVMGFIFIQRLYLSEVRQLNKLKHKKENPAGWILVSVFSVLLLWFPTGLLGVYPSVIISGSMTPGIDIGDMVIVKKARPEEIKKGDVIQFIRQDKKIVTHRVLDIVKNVANPYYVTKGDANNIKDDPVKFTNLKGKMVARLPKIGWVSIAVRTSVKGNPDMTGRGVNR